MTEAYVTLITNDSYAKGALVLGQSLRNCGTTKKLVVMMGYKPDTGVKQALQKTFDESIEVSLMDSGDATRLALMSRPELGVTFTKLQCWTLTHYAKCVFMDADTLVVENIDNLFEREELSAAPDIGWPDMFNTGVFVFKPSMETYGKLIDLAKTEGSFDGGDQGLLNSYFSDWSTTDISRHLPFVYNMAANLTYSYLPALLKFGTQVKVVHFLGSSKPWNFSYSSESDNVYGGGSSSSDGMFHTTKPFIRTWWKVYNHSVPPLFKVEETSGAAPTIQTTVPASGAPISSETSSGDSKGAAPSSSGPPRPATQDQWERGEVNYTGDDRFQNIQRHLDAMIYKNGNFY